MDFIDPPGFMKIFTRGIYRDMLAGIPVRLILNQDTALLGAATAIS
jgi:glucokinase